MTAAFLSTLSARLALLVMLLTSMPLHAVESSQHQVVDGIAVYLGILPAEILLGHQVDSAGREMHGSVPPGNYRYHVVVAIFDANTGLRISNAQVEARVSETGHTGLRKKLEPMLIQGTVTYGDYFTLPTPGPYKVEIEIVQPGATTPTTVVFDYRFGRA
ncbi:MAG: hypothetical protein ACYCY9_15555 [Thiobacillus sp.]